MIQQLPQLFLCGSQAFAAGALTRPIVPHAVTAASSNRNFLTRTSLFG